MIQLKKRNSKFDGFARCDDCSNFAEHNLKIGNQEINLCENCLIELKVEVTT